MPRIPPNETTSDVQLADASLRFYRKEIVDPTTGQVTARETAVQAVLPFTRADGTNDVDAKYDRTLQDLVERGVLTNAQRNNFVTALGLIRADARAQRTLT